MGAIHRRIKQIHIIILRNAHLESIVQMYIFYALSRLLWVHFYFMEHKTVDNFPHQNPTIHVKHHHYPLKSFSYRTIHLSVCVLH